MHSLAQITICFLVVLVGLISAHNLCPNLNCNTGGTNMRAGSTSEAIGDFTATGGSSSTVIGGSPCGAHGRLTTDAGFLGTRCQGGLSAGRIPRRHKFTTGSINVGSTAGADVAAGGIGCSLPGSRGCTGGLGSVGSSAAGAGSVAVGSGCGLQGSRGCTDGRIRPIGGVRGNLGVDAGAAEVVMPHVASHNGRASVVGGNIGCAGNKMCNRPAPTGKICILGRCYESVDAKTKGVATGTLTKSAGDSAVSAGPGGIRGLATHQAGSKGHGLTGAASASKINSKDLFGFESVQSGGNAESVGDSSVSLTRSKTETVNGVSLTRSESSGQAGGYGRSASKTGASASICGTGVC